MATISLRLAGYAELVQRHKLAVIPNWHESAVGAGTTHRTQEIGGRVQEVYPADYWPGNDLGDHLEFALKYDGTNLQILAALFSIIPDDEIIFYLNSKPTGRYARRIWYLHELLTHRKLALPDLKQGNYIDLLDRNEYVTSTGVAIQRQRIRDNLLGDARFCPMVRRTGRLREFESSDPAKRCRELMDQYPVELLKRALGYLYTKESKSSFEIEHISPSATRTERFVSLLQTAEKEDYFVKTKLIDLQNRIVDQRFQDHDYTLDEQGKMTVNNDTASYYRYMDLTSQVEVLFNFIRDTIDTELKEELAFLLNYDQTKLGIQKIVDMPDRMIDLFIRCCLQNHGTLSKRKREEIFQKLSDEEISKMQKIVQQAYQLHPENHRGEGTPSSE